ncbi:MAG: hypothetical protein FJ206_07355 [Gemmatimonadetes bacterium]|nr:hypothetical protein [Gemmatimonadota bacterium]
MRVAGLSVAVLVVLPSFVRTPAALGQSKTAVIQGRVVTSVDATPWPGVRITMLSLRRTIATDSLGRFAFADLKAGSYQVEARVIGFTPMSALITVNGGETKEVEFRTDAAGQILPTIFVEGEPLPEPARALSTFERRMALGTGRYITREQIVQRNPHRIVDMIRFLPGVRSECRGHTCRLMLSRGLQSCAPAIYVDNQETSLTVLENTPANDIQGIEVYTGPAEVPPELNNETARCGGVIALWTRRGRMP